MHGCVAFGGDHGRRDGVLAVGGQFRPRILSHKKRNRYRLRCGDYRVIYEVRRTVLRVLVVRLGHCKDVYRNLQ